jgi:hypothetical protein
MLELKNIDPLSSRELDIQHPKRVEIRSFKRAPSETQFTIATVFTDNVL